MSNTLTIPLPLLQQAPRAPASPFAVAVAASVVLHMAAFAWAAQQERVQVAPAPKDVEPVAIRSVHMDVPPLKPVTPPPPVVEQVPPPQVAKAPAAPKAKTKPKKVRRVKRRQRRQAAAPKPAAPKPAALPVQTAAQGDVAVQAEETVDSGAPVAASAVLAAPAVIDAPVAQVDLSGYGSGVRAAVLRQQRYPDVAEDDGLEGRVLVHIQVGRDGALVGQPKIKRSSGHPCLDREAVRMVRAAAPFRTPPAGVEGGVAELELPIVFELDEDDF